MARRLARACDAEGVASGVGEHHPAKVVADAVPTDLGRSRRREPGHLGVDIGGAEIQVHPVLAGRGVVHLLEAQPGAVGPDDGDELAGYQFLRLTFELLRPPLRELCGIDAVEGDHLHVECHTHDLSPATMRAHWAR